MMKKLFLLSPVISEVMHSKTLDLIPRWGVMWFGVKQYLEMSKTLANTGIQINSLTESRVLTSARLIKITKCMKIVHYPY